jgi:hypothetical protein
LALELAYPIALDQDGSVLVRYRALSLPAHF